MKRMFLMIAAVAAIITLSGCSDDAQLAEQKRKDEAIATLRKQWITLSEPLLTFAAEAQGTKHCVLIGRFQKIKKFETELATYPEAVSQSHIEKAKTDIAKEVYAAVKASGTFGDCSSEYPLTTPIESRLDALEWVIEVSAHLNAGFSPAEARTLIAKLLREDPEATFGGKLEEYKKKYNFQDAEIRQHRRDSASTSAWRLPLPAPIPLAPRRPTPFQRPLESVPTVELPEKTEVAEFDFFNREAIARIEERVAQYAADAKKFKNLILDRDGTFNELKDALADGDPFLIQKAVQHVHAAANVARIMADTQKQRGRETLTALGTLYSTRRTFPKTRYIELRDQLKRDLAEAEKKLPEEQAQFLDLARKAIPDYFAGLDRIERLTRRR